MNTKRSSRREFLKWSGMAVTGALLAACQPITADGSFPDAMTKQTSEVASSSLDTASYPEVVKLPNGFQPEGIAIGRGTDLFVGSIGRLDDAGERVIGGAVYQGDLSNGTGKLLIQPQADRTALGMSVDKRTNYLFVCGGPYGEVYVYDTATGDTAAVYRVSDGPMFSTILNDVIVTEDAAYITDTALPNLYRLPLGPNGTLPEQSAIETIPLTGDFVFDPATQSMNGIEATADGKWLIVVQTNSETMYRVAPESGATTRIDVGNATTPGDGLVLLGQDLYVVDGASNQILAISMTDDFSAGVMGVPLTHPGLRFPSTAAPFGDFLYAVNARFDVAIPSFFPDADPPDPALEYEAVKVARN